MSLQLVGFWGIGTRQKQHPPLVRVGHVGWQLPDDARVWGFHPTVQAVVDAGGDDAALTRLRTGESLPGAVHDDTEIFVYAAALAPTLEAANARRVPWVWSQSLDLPADEIGRIRQQTLQWYTDRTTFPYSFPRPNGPDNCATFPARLGIPLPEPTGLLAQYIPALQRVGQKWQKG